MGFTLLLTLARFWRPLVLASVFGAAVAWHLAEVRHARLAGIEACKLRASDELDRRLQNALDAENRLRDPLVDGGGFLPSDGFKRLD